MITVAVFGSSTTEPHTPGWDEAFELGRQIAIREWAVATGGYGGTMEAVSAGAASERGRIIGITAPSIFPSRSGVNAHVTDEVVEHSISHRIARLVETSHAAIALPGSIGTFAELVVAWNAAFVAPFRGATPRPVVAVGATWRSLIRSISAELPTGHGFVHVTDTATDAVELVERMVSRDGVEGI